MLHKLKGFFFLSTKAKDYRERWIYMSEWILYRLGQIRSSSNWNKPHVSYVNLFNLVRLKPNLTKKKGPH
jgi:hypothetical protein